MHTVALPDLNYLKECFVLDPLLPCGLRWADDRPLSHFKTERGYKIWKKKYSNKPCGSMSTHKYFITELSSQDYSNHRIIFAIYNNTINFQDKNIDHIDGNSLNNSPENLRLATASQNSFNSKKRKDNTTGYKNIQCRKDKEIGKFIVRLQLNGKFIRVGSYKTLEEALQVRDSKLKEMVGEFYRTI